MQYHQKQPVTRYGTVKKLESELQLNKVMKG